MDRVLRILRVGTSQRLPPPVLAALSFLTQWVISRRRKPTAGSFAVAAPVGAISAWLMGRAAVTFHQRHTTVHPINLDPTTLVTDGPNRMTRNPMYVGMAGMLVAHAVARRSLRAGIPAALFVFVIDRWQIPAEESALLARFGDDYARYRAATPRWLLGRDVCE